jgi:hypothetical protein
VQWIAVYYRRALKNFSRTTIVSGITNNVASGWLVRDGRANYKLSPVGLHRLIYLKADVQYDEIFISLMRDMKKDRDFLVHSSTLILKKPTKYERIQSLFAF